MLSLLLFAGLVWPLLGRAQTASIYQAGWTSPVDIDGDNYKRSSYLYWDSDVSNPTNSLTVYEKIYYKLSSGSSWSLSYTTLHRTITGKVTDNQYLFISEAGHNREDR